MLFKNLVYKLDIGKNLSFHGCSDWDEGFRMETHSIKLEVLDDNKVIGQVGLEYKDRDTEEDLEDGYLFSVSVNPDYQGLGLGSKLMKEIEFIAKKVGVKTLYLRPNSEEVMQFYNKCGYKYDHTDEYGKVMSKKI
jgi:ribosomal protein S18 acetylase RimI-like enzyme